MCLVEDWLKHNRPYALQIARRIMGGNRDEAEDAVAKAALRAIRSAHTYNSAQPMRRWFCPILTMARFAWSRAGTAKKSPQTPRLANVAKNASSKAGKNAGNGMDLRFDFGDVQADAEPVELPDGLLEALSGVDQEMASSLLELRVLQLAHKAASEGRGWSNYQMSEQLKAAQEKLEKLRAARGGHE